MFYEHRTPAALQHWSAAKGVRFEISLMCSSRHFVAEQLEEHRLH